MASREHVRLKAFFCAILVWTFWSVRAQGQGPVLDLDGTGGYVELPPNVFNDLTESTVEAWVKIRSFPTVGLDWARFFSYGAENKDTGIQLERSGRLFYFISDAKNGEAVPATQLAVERTIRSNEWYHVAAVSGPGGMKLFLDGAVLATNSYPGSFAAVRNGARFRLGRSVVDRESPVDGLALRPDLMRRLQAEERDAWAHLSQTMAMGEIEAFAARLHEVAERGGWERLRAYARRIAQQAAEFDLDRLPQTLQEFPAVCQELAAENTRS